MRRPAGHPIASPTSARNLGGPGHGSEPVPRGSSRHRGAGPDLVDAGAIRARSPWQLFWRRFKEDQLALASLVFVAFLILIAIFAPLVVDIAGAPGPDERDTERARPVLRDPHRPQRRPPLRRRPDRPRRLQPRTIYGARVSLVVAFVGDVHRHRSSGIVTGLLAGYFRGWTDTIISRSVDVLLAIPYLLLATGLAAACTPGDHEAASRCGLLRRR